MSKVTQAERDQFEAIRQKMIADQSEAIKEFGELMATDESVDFVNKIESLRERCVVGSNEYTQMNNIVLVINSVKAQFPITQQMEAPSPAPV